MEFSVGSVFDGKVTGITKFGAFVSLSEGKSGLVHISENAHTYVNDIHEHLVIGQEVKVKLIGFDKDGKLNLSIKKTVDPPLQERRPYQERRPEKGGQDSRSQEWGQRPPAFYTPKQNDSIDFEDKLKLFMQDSKSKMSDNKNYSDRRGASRPRRPK